MQLSKNYFLIHKFTPFFIGLLFLFFSALYSFAQTVDTTIVIKQTVKYHSPKKAAFMSALLPGFGQVYNKTYWKVPVIYIGFAALAYSINYNQTKYVTYRNAYKYRIDGDPATVDDYVGRITDDNLNTLQKYYHRYRDLSVIGTAALYLLNIIDASVDGHFFNFNVNEDLSFNVHPTLINTVSSNQYTTGISFNIKF